MKNLIALGPNKSKFSMLQDALTYIDIHQFDDFDWILKSNDNSFVVMENLKYLLYQYNSDWPLVIGQKFVNDFMPGVYAISKQAYLMLVEKAFRNQELCHEETGNDDIDIAKCMKNVGVMSVDSLDREGRGMFFAKNPRSALFPVNNNNYDSQFLNKFEQGIDKCCSDQLVVVQELKNTQIYVFEYFLYKVKVFGRKRKMRKLPEKFLLEEIIEQQKASQKV